MYKIYTAIIYKIYLKYQVVGGPTASKETFNCYLLQKSKTPSQDQLVSKLKLYFYKTRM